MKSNIKYGLQMFGCSADFNKDTDYFFKTMSGYGYKIIEPCIVFDEGSELANLVWDFDKTPVYVNQMAKYGLEIYSAHIFCSDYEKSMPRLKELAEKVGIRAYVINTPQEAIDNPAAFSDTLNYVAAELKKVGVELWLHNSGGDFRKKTLLDGEEVFVYEYLLRKSKDVFAQVDTGWVMVGGIEPQDFMRKYISKLKCIHFKDLYENFDELGTPKMFAVLGDGRTDVKACLDVNEDGKLPVIIDQDMPISGNIFADMKKSIDLLKSLENK